MMKNARKTLRMMGVVLLGLAMSCSLARAATFTNGGFEDGGTGWTIDPLNCPDGGIVTMDQDGHPAASEGSKALYYDCSDHAGSRLYCYQQNLDVSGTWQVSLAYYLTSCSGTASSWLQVEGFNASGTRKIYASYWWGLGNLNYNTGEPGTQGADFYKLKMRVGDNPPTYGQWFNLTADIQSDFNAEFDDASYGVHQATWSDLGVTTITLQCRGWGRDDPNYGSIVGYFDNVQLLPEPATMALLLLGLPLALRRRRK